MTPYTFNGPAWQESWDRQQEAYLPDREERFTAMLDAVEAVTEWPAPRILDLAGGTGSIALRAQRRFPQANTTLLDLDPVTLAIARATLDERSTVVTANLIDPGWVAALPHRDYDAVLVATALHWLTPERLAALYAEIRTVLRPGGILVNADHMPDDGLPGLSKRLGERADARREARYAAGAVLSWNAWWDHAKTDPTLAPLVTERAALFTADHHQEWLPPASWHQQALRDAGFTEVGLIWRGAQDAAVAGVR
ncbi:class I SAM-dependent methyltransferase [Catenuloplanes japonicus]|uniref:class I SAM-dependent methyltransferase n=1 Tax=Catenuloplanes japonicus TaxID=33876 RepID=UPI00052446F1|nr:class I SAM-dependent methyltransferase [Catenuloplanes japonicus]